MLFLQILVNIVFFLYSKDCTLIVHGNLSLSGHQRERERERIKISMNKVEIARLVFAIYKAQLKAFLE